MNKIPTLLLTYKDIFMQIEKKKKKKDKNKVGQSTQYRHWAVFFSRKKGTSYIIQCLCNWCYDLVSKNWSFKFLV